MKQTFIFLVLLCIGVSLRAQILVDSIAITESYYINEIKVNTEGIEFCPSKYKNYLMYVMANPDADKDDNLDDHFLDIAYAALDQSNRLGNNAFLPLQINSAMHEGQAAYDPIHKKIFFTRSYYDKKRGTNRDTIVLKIFEASESDNFKNPKPLKFCSDKYSVCHPTLNQAGDMLIFSSNMPGSAGMDLYYSLKIGQDWAPPTPLSKNINTRANEVFPYFYKDSVVFFSVNKPGGKGGLDIYYTTLIDTGWTAPVVLPFPINSSFDDIGFILNDDETSGYTSSNRPGGEGKDDIYFFKSKVPILKRHKLSKYIESTIAAVDKLSFSPLAQAQIVINELASNNILNAGQELKIAPGDKQGEYLLKINPDVNHGLSYTTDDNGKLAVSLKRETNYILTFKAKGYEDQVILYNPSLHGVESTIVANPKEEISTSSNSPASISKPTSNIIIPTEVGSSIVFENIYYEYNSANIREDASDELSILANAMVQNPHLKVQLSAHTDARGSSKYNLELSQKRALAAKNYLILRRVDPSRIQTIGYGESQIRNQCTEGVKCSEADHLYNRRTEVLIID
jgi:outer membrane protein OmpA-like peptidoglycan-associated protein